MSNEAMLSILPYLPLFLLAVILYQARRDVKKQDMPVGLSRLEIDTSLIPDNLLWVLFCLHYIVYVILLTVMVGMGFYLLIRHNVQQEDGVKVVMAIIFAFLLGSLWVVVKLEKLLYAAISRGMMKRKG